MKIKIVSDIHLEGSQTDWFLCDNPEKADVLILAGDITNANKADRYAHFFKRCSQNYKEVIYVFGNHEHYKFNIDRSRDFIQTMLDNEHITNIHILENQGHIVKFKDKSRIIFWGATLWSDCDYKNPVNNYDISRFIADFRVITKGEDYNKFTTEDARTLNSVAIHKMQDFLEHRRGPHGFNNDKHPPEQHQKIVMVTHFAPSWKSVHEKYTGDSCNGYFVNNLDKMIEYYPEIALWVHGHVHNSFDYTIGNTRVVANPHGYSKAGKDRENLEFNYQKIIEV